MKKLMFLVLLLPLLAFAEPGQRTLTWDAPTERRDGRELPFAEISHYTLACGSGVSLQIPAESPEGRYMVSRDDIMPGGGYGETGCTLSVTDTDGNESEPSNAAAVWFYAPPSAPTNLIIIE